MDVVINLIQTGINCKDKSFGKFINNLRAWYQAWHVNKKLKYKYLIKAYRSIVAR